METSKNFVTLPKEVIMSIMSYLDYDTIYALLEESCYFRSFISDKLLLKHGLPFDKAISLRRESYILKYHDMYLWYHSNSTFLILDFIRYDFTKVLDFVLESGSGKKCELADKVFCKIESFNVFKFIYKRCDVSSYQITLVSESSSISLLPLLQLTEGRYNFEEVFRQATFQNNKEAIAYLLEKHPQKINK